MRLWLFPTICSSGPRSRVAVRQALDDLTPWPWLRQYTDELRYPVLGPWTHTHIIECPARFQSTRCHCRAEPPSTRQVFAYMATPICMIQGMPYNQSLFPIRILLIYVIYMMHSMHRSTFDANFFLTICAIYYCHLQCMLYSTPFVNKYELKWVNKYIKMYATS